MIHVSVNYLAPPSGDAPGPLERLRSVTWLIENARHLAKFAGPAAERLHLVFVGHTQSLTPDILEQLSETCTIHIETILYEQLAAAYPGLMNRLGGHYRTFSFGFLRWLLIARLFPGEPVLCYDGDILHNVPLASLGSAFRGITRTATSTAFAAISNPDWFTGWARNLARLDRAPADFLARHLGSLPYGMESFVASPEEHFAKFLIEAGEIPHDELDPSFPYWLIPQPQILPRLYNYVATRELNHIPAPMRYERIWGSDMLNGKPVAFWHMQKPFMSQLSALAIFRESGPGRDPGRIYGFNHYGSPGTAEIQRFADPFRRGDGHAPLPRELEPLAAELIVAERRNGAQQIAPERNFFHPAFLYRYYFEIHDLSLLFNNQRWPRPGCWTS